MVSSRPKLKFKNGVDYRRNPGFIAEAGVCCSS